MPFLFNPQKLVPTKIKPYTVTWHILSQGTTSARDTKDSEDEDDDNLDEKERADKYDKDDDRDFEQYFSNKMRNSCLKQLYPAIYDDEFERLRVIERVAGLFICCLGVRGSLRIGPTGFRTFARFVYGREGRRAVYMLSGCTGVIADRTHWVQEVCQVCIW